MNFPKPYVKLLRWCGTKNLEGISETTPMLWEKYYTEMNSATRPFLHKSHMKSGIVQRCFKPHCMQSPSVHQTVRVTLKHSMSCMWSRVESLMDSFMALSSAQTETPMKHSRSLSTSWDASEIHFVILPVQSWIKTCLISTLISPKIHSKPFQSRRTQLMRFCTLNFTPWEQEFWHAHFFFDPFIEFCPSHLWCFPRIKNSGVLNGTGYIPVAQTYSAYS